MKIFERYVAWLTLGIFVAVAFGLVALFLVIDFGDWLRIYTGKPVIDVVTLYWYRSHLALVQFAPAAMVLSAALSITVVRRRGEWTALRALGASPLTMLRPIAIVCSLGALVLVVFQETVVSTSGPRTDRIMVERFNRWGDFSAVYSPRRWFKAGHALVNVRGEVSAEGLQDVRVFELGPHAELTRWLQGSRLVYVAPDRWRLEGVDELVVTGDDVSRGREGDVELALPMKAEVTQLAIGRPEWLPMRTLLGQVDLMRALELPTEATIFAIHQRWASLVASVLAALLAAVLALRSTVSASVPRALIQGAGLYGLLFVSSMIARSVAINGRLAPSLAAWVMPLLLGALLLRMARRA